MTQENCLQLVFKDRTQNLKRKFHCAALHKEKTHPPPQKKIYRVHSDLKK